MFAGWRATAIAACLPTERATALDQPQRARISFSGMRIDYRFSGVFHPQAVLSACAREFIKAPKWNTASQSDLLFVLGRLAWDSRILDVRYVAYVMATLFIETSHTVRVVVPTLSSNGHSKKHVVKQWRNFAPVAEVIGKKVGHRRYLDPVKVAQLPNGDACVTERDGDQWRIGKNGIPKPLTEEARKGVALDSSVSSTYAEAPGDEHVYFGRGYVQLTWWSNYAKASVELGRGLEFLFNPERVLEPLVAYELMIRGLCTGSGFANGRTFARYFTNERTDYVHARDMVNPGASLKDKQEFASVCKRFEKVLISARNQALA